MTLTLAVPPVRRQGVTVGTGAAKGTGGVQAAEGTAVVSKQALVHVWNTEPTWDERNPRPDQHRLLGW